MCQVEKIITLTERMQRLEIELTALRIGRDIQVFITGGAAHIGATALGIPYGAGSANASLISAKGHQEGQLSYTLAVNLSKALRVNVIVTMGIHYDALSKEELANVQDIILNLEKAFIKLMKN